jgi:hypothetical protein
MAQILPALAEQAISDFVLALRYTFAELLGWHRRAEVTQDSLE